jgi:hypothetical protein
LLEGVENLHKLSDFVGRGGKSSQAERLCWKARKIFTACRLLLASHGGLCSMQSGVETCGTRIVRQESEENKLGAERNEDNA